MAEVHSNQQSVNYIDNVFPYTFPCSGHVQFTGPNGLRDYKPHLINDPRAVGIGAVSNEQSLDTAYLLRPAPGATLERPRSCRPGEVGWGVPWLVDWSPANSGQQITLGDFRQIAEDRTTHEGTGAWYPHPEQNTPQGREGYYKENIFSGRPGTSNLRYRSHSRTASPRRPARSDFVDSGHHGDDRNGNHDYSTDDATEIGSDGAH